MRFNQPMSKNVQKGRREVKKTSEGSKICDITGELLFNAVLPRLQKGIEISCSMLCWHVSECWLHLVMVVSSIYLKGGQGYHPPPFFSSIPEWWSQLIITFQAHEWWSQPTWAGIRHCMNSPISSVMGAIHALLNYGSQKNQTTSSDI